MSDEFEKAFLSTDFSSLIREKQSRQDPQNGQELPFKVCVDDNFHYMDESERTTHGTFATAEEAIEACKRIVLESVRSNLKSGMTADELYGRYKSFGDDPFVVASAGGDVKFSAWEYAKQLCAEICSK